MLFKHILFSILLLTAFIGFGYSLRRMIRIISMGKPENRMDRIWQRIIRMLVVAFGQSKIFREKTSGIMHAFIFWGFLVLLTSIIEAIGEGLVPGFSLRFLGIFYPPIVFMQELFAGLVIIGVGLALFRRYIVRPKRLRVDRKSMIDATLILLTILAIMMTFLGQNATRTQLSYVEEAKFLSNILIPYLASSDNSTSKTLFEVYWWIHIILVLSFLNYLPYSKHAHIITSIPNVFLTSLEPKGALKPINFEEEGLEKFGAIDVHDLTWKQVLDGFTCTECGRCTASCPANITGKQLSPKQIMMNVRKRAVEKGKVLFGGKLSEENKKQIADNTLLHNYVTKEELFACTTCMSCMEECPVNNEHVPTIVDLRRSLVLMESSFPQEVQVVFKNLETNFNPWAFPPSSRAEWAEGMDIPLISQNQDAEILFWVGCAGAFDARYKKVTVAFARLLKQANVRFAILGNEEKCSGDSARRIGNEYLAQMLMKENVEILNKYNVKKIVTACPHCYNTIKNEYPQFGGKYEVYHHTEYLLELIKQEKLKISGKKEARVAYHDSCYLGRYNDIYEQPREILKSISGIILKEMARNKSRGFCCGAGGGRMWMEEKEGKRVNIERTEEALSLKPEIIATACPFCMTMLEDGLKDKESLGNVKVVDIAEILGENVE